MKQENIAAIIAGKYHRGQKYGHVPYIYHVVEVVESLEGVIADDSQLAVAWLHDVIEDTDCTYATLLDSGCSLRVIDAVSCITKVDGETYEEYITKVRSNPDALLVKKHDTLCNLTQSLKEGNSHRIKKYAKQLLLLEE